MDPEIKRAAAAELAHPEEAARIRTGLTAEENAAVDAAKAAIQGSVAHWRAAVGRKLTRPERASMIRDLFDPGSAHAEALDDSERCEFAACLLHRGVLSAMTLEAARSEFDAVGSWGDRRVYLDAKHRGGEEQRSGRPAVPLGTVDKKDGQINRYRAEGGGLVFNLVFHTARELPENRGLYYVPGFCLGREVSYSQRQRRRWDQAFNPDNPLQPVQLLDGSELDRLLQGDVAMLKEAEKRVKSYLSQADEDAIEEALKDQTSEVKLKVADKALADEQDRRNYGAKWAATEEGRREMLEAAAAADPEVAKALKAAGLL
jgi:hypothetical protein